MLKSILKSVQEKKRVYIPFQNHLALMTITPPIIAAQVKDYDMKMAVFQLGQKMSFTPCNWRWR